MGKDFDKVTTRVSSPSVLLTNTTWWPSAARLAMVLAKAGCRVSAVIPKHGHPLLKTSIVERVFRYGAINPLGSLIAAIETAKPEVIIPCDDRAVMHLHVLHERTRSQGAAGSKLAALVERSVGSPAAYPIVSARYELMRVAGEEGIRTPKTALVHTEADLEPWSGVEPFPWVLKVDGSWGGHGVKIVHDLGEAKAALSKMAKPLGAWRALKRCIVNRDAFWIQNWLQRSKPKMTIQSYVEGRPANRAILCSRGKVLAGISVEVVGAWSLTGSATVVRVVNNPEMEKATERLARRLELSGFHGFDFMIESGSDAVYLIEMNPRCTPLCHLQFGEGRDLIGALWPQLTGEPGSSARCITKNDLVAYFPQACLWNPHSEFLQSAYHDVPWEEPELVKELLRLPWPDRSVVARMSDRFRRQTYAERSAQGRVFPEALAGTRSETDDCLRGPGASRS